MSSANSSLKGFLRAIVSVFRECDEAQRRMTALRIAPDRYEPRPDAAPDTYAEFLFRASGALIREPPARSRTARR
jgi:hypothetical protein